MVSYPAREASPVGSGRSSENVVPESSVRFRCLQLVLVLVLCAPGACRRRTPPTPPAPPVRSAPTATAQADAGPSTATDQGEPPADPAQFTNAGQWFPQRAVGPWAQSGPVVRAARGNVFQIIDGEADSYERYGLRSFARTEYRLPGTPLVITGSVYEFAEPLGAFGRYSLMVSDGRDPESLRAQAVSFGRGGYLGGTQLAYSKGNVLVQLSIADASDEPNEAALLRAAPDALTRLGQAIETRLPGSCEMPPSPLRSDGLVWGGATYVADGVFGVDGTGPAWVGHYRAPSGQRYRLAVFASETAAAAARLLDQFGADDGQTLPGLGDRAAALPADESGEMIVVRRGATVWVLTGSGVATAHDLERADALNVLRAALAPDDAGMTRSR